MAYQNQEDQLHLPDNTTIVFDEEVYTSATTPTDDLGRKMHGYVMDDKFHKRQIKREVKFSFVALVFFLYIGVSFLLTG